MYDNKLSNEMFLLDDVMCAISDLSDFVRFIHTARHDSHYYELANCAFERAFRYIKKAKVVYNSYMESLDTLNKFFV